jgi:hypothetical protein
MSAIAPAKFVEPNSEGDKDRVAQSDATAPPLKGISNRNCPPVASLKDPEAFSMPEAGARPSDPAGFPGDDDVGTPDNDLRLMRSRAVSDWMGSFSTA